MKKVLFILIVILLLVVMAVGGYKIYEGLHAYDVIEKYYDTAEQYIVSVPDTPREEATAVSQAPESVETEISVPEEASVLEKEEEPVETAPISIDFSALMKDCPDTIGWLHASDGSVNLPVVQGTDNQYYLTHLPNGNYSSGGSLFLDYLNSADFSDESSFIYGHNMKNGTMLQPILEYQKQAYYDAYPVMYLLTPEQDFKLELFAGVLTPVESDVYTFSFESPESKQTFIDSLVERSTFVPQSIPTAEDRILCLSTCAYDYDNARYVVFAKLTEIG